MNRRKLLLGSGAVLSTTIAGCSSDEIIGGNGGDADGARFEIESLDMSDEVEIGREWSWSITIANTGEAESTFETVVYAKSAATDFVEIGNIELDIAAIETATYESGVGVITYLTRATYRFETLGTEHEIRVGPRSLSVGESYESPLQIVTSVAALELGDTYRDEGSDGNTKTEEASSGMQWAILEFEATNESGSSESLPPADAISVLAGNSQYDATDVNEGDHEYEGGEVQAGVSRRGELVYEIPEALNVTDLEVAYSDNNVAGEWSVRWRLE